jgi:glucose-6-phosphate 1-epimerase
MMAEELQGLNQRYGIPGELDFVAGPAGLPVASIRNEAAAAGVCLLGGHVLSYQPHGQEPVLWVSGKSWFEVGKPIRGGIPVCWPWFGTQAPSPGLPHHGCVRTRMWEVRASESADGATRIVLGLCDDEGTRALWPHRFDLQIAVTVGERMRVELTARNTDSAPWSCTGALHSYFSVSDVACVEVHGLEGCRYRTKVEDPPENRQEGPITIAAEVDRVYTDTTAECAIEDPGLRRRIRIAKEGSRTTVVWNPWIEKSRRMPDFGDEEYHGMLCVETANAGKDVIALEPGESHSLCATITAERL